MEERLDSENTQTRRFERVKQLAWCDIVPVASKVMGRDVIERIQNGVDHVLRKEQAGFLRNIIEQVNEWQATFYAQII